MYKIILILIFSMIVGIFTWKNYGKEIICFFDENSLTSTVLGLPPKSRMESVQLFTHNEFPEIEDVIRSLAKERKNAEAKIYQLNLLTKEYPKQKEKIDRSVNNWTRIVDNTSNSISDIDIKLEEIFVLHKLRKYGSKANFEKMSSELLKKASSSLRSINVIKNTIEKEVL